MENVEWSCHVTPVYNWKALKECRPQYQDTYLKIQDIFWYPEYRPKMLSLLPLARPYQHKKKLMIFFSVKDLNIVKHSWANTDCMAHIICCLMYPKAIV